MSGSPESPHQQEVLEIGERLGLPLSESDASRIAHVTQSFVGLLRELRELDSEAWIGVAPSPTRDRGHVPKTDEDPFNAFIRVCDVRGADSGELAGMRVGLKDNIDVAGIPTTNGSSTSPYVPKGDAVVAERILAKGGRIVGKLNMDNFGYGATGETSAFGPPRNPRAPERSAGGSSGGSGAAVASGAVDAALGVDQGGSARIPASFCGVVAIKPTHGLVPTYGVSHIDHTIDHVCPMAATVGKARDLLEAIAGSDWRDPQWTRLQVGPSWRCGQEPDVSRLRVAVISDSIDTGICNPEVLACFRATVMVLEPMVASVTEIDVPLWRHGLGIAQVLQCHLIAAMTASEGVGYGHLGLIDVERTRSFARVRRSEAERLPPVLKACMVTERYLHERNLNADFALVHNLRLRLRRELDEVFDAYDVVLTPTTPVTAPLLCSPDENDSAVSDMLRLIPFNTAPFNLSGHPAVAIPNGEDDLGLPTSVQIATRRLHDEDAIYVAAALEEVLELGGR